MDLNKLKPPVGLKPWCDKMQGLIDRWDLEISVSFVDNFPGTNSKSGVVKEPVTTVLSIRKPEKDSRNWYQYSIPGSDIINQPGNLYTAFNSGFNYDDSTCDTITLTLNGSFSWYADPEQASYKQLLVTLLDEWSNFSSETVMSVKYSDAHAKANANANANAIANAIRATMMNHDRDALRGGAARTPASTAWVSVGRKVTLKDGRVRALFRCASKPGQFRIRRMVTRAGRTVATYVKPT
jgi:hypothetical protein